MIKCQIFGMNRLINHEFPRAYTLIVTQFMNEDFEVEDVQLAYEGIIAHNKELKFVKEGIAKHPLTKQIAELRDIRHDYLLSLRGTVTYALKSHDVKLRKAAIVIDEWLEMEHKFLRSKSIQKQAESVSRLAHDLTLMPSLTEHLETLGLNSAMVSLVEVTEQLDTLYLRRNAEQRAATRKSEQIRRDAYTGMKTFVVAMDQVIKLKKGDVAKHLNYIELINGVMSKFDAATMSKDTRKKSADEKAEAEANQEANPEKGEQENGGCDVPNGGKPAMASRSRTFSPMGMDGMDLQNGGTRGAFAMSNGLSNNTVTNSSLTNGGATNGADAAKADEGMIDLSAGDGGVVNNTLGNTETGHKGATMKDEDDHES